MYNAITNMNQLQEVLTLEERTKKKLKKGILYELSKERNGVYLKKTYENYSQKLRDIEEKVKEKIEKNTISEHDLQFIADRWADVIMRNMKGLQYVIKKPADKKIKPENIADAICLIEADLKYIKKML